MALGVCCGDYYDGEPEPRCNKPHTIQELLRKDDVVFKFIPYNKGFAHDKVLFYECQEWGRRIIELREWLDKEGNNYLIGSYGNILWLMNLKKGG